jgi:Mn-dependent DtxR family transcriptional regulator
MTDHYVRHLAPKELLERVNARTAGSVPAAVPAMTTAALADRRPAPASPPPVVSIDPPPLRGIAAQRRIGQRETAEQIMELLRANGGAATQADLRRELGLVPRTAMRHLHRLQEQGRIIHAGLNRNRSIVWKVAPPTARLRHYDYRQAPRGEGPQRVLDAVEWLGGRGSQAELARVLGVAPGTVHSHCLELEADGLLEKGALDKSTSHRGSQVWRVPAPPTRRVGRAGGWTMRIAAPRPPR